MAKERLADVFLEFSVEERAALYTLLEPHEKEALFAIVKSELDNPWAMYETDPVAFVEKGLGEIVWSKQKEVMQSVLENKRTVVPAGHSVGKSHMAQRLATWWMSSHPAGTAICITTAPTFRQVRNIMWSGIRRIHQNHNLIGEILTNQWKIDGTVVAYGFSPQGNDESAVQGIHAPHLLIIVDEAGGISDTIGKALESLMTGGHTRLLAIGNPPTDQEQTWFERICSSPLYNVITIGAYDAPNFTGESTGLCTSCPQFVPPHEVATHLVDQTWVNDVISEFGEDSPFVEARVYARFPKSSVGKVVPFSWCELAKDNDYYLESRVIKLGVDIASDGGDEFVIAKADGFKISMVHRSSGKSNANAVDVAGVIWEQILKAVEIHTSRELREKVRVKIDSIGVGWGVVSLLKNWVKEKGMANRVEIIGVNVANRPKDPKKFKNQRSEMWWNMRQLLQPKPETVEVEDEVTGEITQKQIQVQDIRLDVDRQLMAQLAGPSYTSDSAGRIIIESKKDMKQRGVHSPDRAEAVLLALYEPSKNTSTSIPLSVSQENEWAM